MLNLLEKIIDETRDDNKLFVRYGFKFYECMEQYPKESRMLLEKKPNFKNEFQMIFLSGLIEHFYKENVPNWYSDDKLNTPWVYIPEYISEDYLPELTKRRIFAI